MRRKTRGLLVVLLGVALALAAVLGVAPGEALAEGNAVDVKFSANGKEVTRTVTLPKTFSCNWESGNGELDEIIKELYNISDGFCNCEAAPSVTSGGDGKVTGGLSGDDQYVTVSGVFVGTATVQGTYIQRTGFGPQELSYSLEISVEEAAEEYPLWVGGVRVTSANKDDLANNHWSYTPAADGAPATLTLDGYTNTDVYALANSEGTAAIYAEQDLTIQLSGENTLARVGKANTDTDYGIIIDDGDLTIVGDGKLDALDETNRFWMGINVYNGDLSLTGGNVSVAAESFGIATYSADSSVGNVTIADGASVWATGNVHADSSGIEANGDVTISGDATVVTATGIQNGIRCGSGHNVTINGGEVNATGKKFGGIVAMQDVSGKGGVVEVNSGTVAAAGDSFGIGADVRVTINGGTVTATGTAADVGMGIYTMNVGINGGTVTASGGYLGVYAPTVTIGEGVSVIAGADKASAVDVTDTFVNNHSQKWVRTESLVPVEGVTLAPSGYQFVEVGQSIALTATVSPDDATDKTVVWGVAGYYAGAVALYSDAGCTSPVTLGEATDVLTVYVMGRDSGMATVTCASNADPTKSASVEVEVPADEGGDPVPGPGPQPTPTPASVVTAPKAKSLTYNGKAQALVAAGKAEGGTMQYSLDGKSWSAKVPTATNAGTYAVRYKVVGDANHKDTAAKSVKSTIAKAKLTSIAKVADQAYAGNAVTPKPAVKSGSKALKAGTDFTYSYKDNTKAGTATVTATGKGNYAGTVKTTFKIVAATTTGRAHLQGSGWQPVKSDPDLYGTTGKSLRMEALSLSLPKGFPVKGSIQYRSHLQGKGWESKWASDGAVSGTIGESRRIEAVQIKLTGDMAKKYDVYYRVHAQNYGWMGWAKNGAKAGTEGMSKRAEAVQVVLVAKGGKAPGATYRGQTRGYAKAYVAK